MIEVSNVTYEYPSRKALDDVSFTIEKGSITALVGPNGAGKTTLLKCLAALSKPFSGSILVDSINIIEHPKECHKRIGFLQDFIGLYNNLTVAQSLTYFAYAYDIPSAEIQARVKEIASKLNLSDKLNERVSALSRGMRQRLAIGQAIIHNPPLLLLDEPASGLDPEARHALSQLFLDLNAQGMTILVSSHILSELDEYASDLIILRDGKISEGKGKSHQEQVKYITVTILNGAEQVLAVLSSRMNVQNVSVEHAHIHFEFSGDEQEQHNLLKHLLDQGVAVTEFSVRKNNLQDQYLNLIKK